MFLGAQDAVTEDSAVNLFVPCLDLRASAPMHADDVDEIGVLGELGRELCHVMLIPVVGERGNHDVDLRSRISLGSGL